MNYWCCVQIEVSEKSADKTVRWESNGRSHQAAETLAPDVYDTDSGPTLSPLGRYQVSGKVVVLQVPGEW